jgi:hypothetical protein
MTKSVDNQKHDSSSAYQRELETIILRTFELKPFPDELKADGFHIDGYSEEDGRITCLAEIYTSLGKLSTGGRRKILSDMYKLVTYKAIKKLSNVSLKIILTSSEASNALNSDSNSNSWVKKSLEQHDIKVIHHQLNPEQEQKLKEVRELQKVGNKKKKK